jgi:hypothetical protein
MEKQTRWFRQMADQPLMHNPLEGVQAFTKRWQHHKEKN